MRSIRALLLLVLTTLSLAPAALAADVWLDARTYYGSPRYYTNTQMDAHVSYSDRLPFGARVTLHYGLAGFTWQNGREVPVDWHVVKDAEAKAVSPFNWTARISETLHYRSAQYYYNKLQFVFQVTLPDGRGYYVKGNDSAFGYYEARLPSPMNSGADDGDPLPNLRRVDLADVWKN
jgi:hypothetical protein